MSKMDHRAFFTLLMLLLGYSQAHPLTDEIEEVIQAEDVVDITTKILESNNGSSEMLLEGDLVIPRTRNALNCWNNNCLWRKGSNGLVEVPYTMNWQLAYYARQKIQRAMQTFHDKTCIRFVPHRSQSDYISIESRDGCYSNLGRTGGKQVVSLHRYGCLFHGVIQHELNHALGFHHEQTRSDRDQYVKINWEYVAPSSVYNFQKQSGNNLNTQYDYSSIMHYGRTAFSTEPGQETITPVPDSSVSIGQRQDLSHTDILRINRLYGCNSQ